jgi:hypothetical protein
MCIFHVLLGFDGGMNQTFHILVREKGTDLVKYDNSNLDKERGVPLATECNKNLK